ncbi:hypothetical protein DD985_01035 [Pseudomonas sp. HMWF011]|nr:hypothetical protein C2U56_10180 [Pseudomonas fluorescens]PTT10939.1 hypothetical protein DBR14_15585 [Pseudomonas sp. HMWF034]PVV78470.1 hypothetical protein DD985_01035 [Pseudomonas sp. HMWF011]
MSSGSVGAGLPAMRTTRCIRYTAAMPSQASQPPQFYPFSALSLANTPSAVCSPINCSRTLPLSSMM